MIHINNCPFCGSIDTEVVSPFNTLKIAVQCKRCKAQGPIKYNTDKAITDWNNISFKATGNDGGDYIDMKLIEQSDDFLNSIVKLEIGNCCVKTIKAEIPIEFITYALTNFVLDNNGIIEAIQNMDWPKEYKKSLIEKTKEIK